jgi:hypothetical protein
VQQEDGIPTTLISLREQLLALDGLQMVGIFRHSPETLVFQRATLLAENGKNLAVAMSGTSHDLVHSLASLIKLWFRNRQPSLLATHIPPTEISAVAELVRSQEMIMGGHVTSEATAAADVPAEDLAGHLIENLAPEVQRLYLWLLDLLVDVLSVSTLNKMNAWNLAIIFSPTLYNEQDLNGGESWENVLLQLTLCRDITKFCFCAINWRKRMLQQQLQPEDER